MATQGIHIIADCIECDFSEIRKQKMGGVKKIISKIIKENQLTELGNYYFSFGEEAFTGVIALAESHISIHTWPELKFVTLDIYVCNVSKDNSESALRIYDELKRLILPKHVKEKFIER